MNVTNRPSYGIDLLRLRVVRLVALSPLFPYAVQAVISTVCLVLLLVMAYFALRESKLADPATHKSRIFSLAAAVAASAVLIFGWRFSA